jgi:hypothetical protein
MDETPTAGGSNKNHSNSLSCLTLMAVTNTASLAHAASAMVISCDIIPALQFLAVSVAEALHFALCSASTALKLTYTSLYSSFFAVVSLRTVVSSFTFLILLIVLLNLTLAREKKFFHPKF